MDVFSDAFGFRAILAGVIAVLVALLLLLFWRLFADYESSFVSGVGESLRRSFIVANPHRLFLLSVVATLILGVFAFWLASWVGVAAALVAGLFGPRAALRLIAQRRARRFVRQLPDALLALASALRAGSNLPKALELMSTRQPAPLSQEFTMVLAEHRVGRPLAQSLADLRRRIDAPELDLMSTAMNVSRRVGGNLADTLESLARTLQEKAHVEGKIDALTSMGRAQGWVVGLLPILIGFVLYRQQPARMSLLFTEWYGWVVLAVVGVMMTVAAWMIRKIVRIDV